MRSSRVRQVLADLALSQVARRSVADLTTSEHRRLVIGTQLVKDPGTVIKQNSYTRNNLHITIGKNNVLNSFKVMSVS